MGLWNFLVEGGTGTGKTSVCHELRRRGYDAVNGDTDLAIRLSPDLVPTTAAEVHGNHGWDPTLVRSLAADRTERFTFFCGGSRNASTFLDVFDAVLVLEIDRPTLLRRLDQRADDDWGSTPEQRELVLRLHAAGDDVPPGMSIDATARLATVVDEILSTAEAVTVAR